MNDPESLKKSIIVLSNAAELVAQVIKAISSDDIADTINSSPITLSTLKSIAQSRFQKAFQLN